MSSGKQMRVKIAVLGNNVGKSTLIHSFLNKQFTDAPVRKGITEQTFQKMLDIEERSFLLEILDTQEIDDRVLSASNDKRIIIIIIIIMTCTYNNTYTLKDISGMDMSSLYELGDAMTIRVSINSNNYGNGNTSSDPNNSNNNGNNNSLISPSDVLVHDYFIRRCWVQHYDVIVLALDRQVRFSFHTVAKLHQFLVGHHQRKPKRSHLSFPVPIVLVSTREDLIDETSLKQDISSPIFV
ncbi:hypothetical protein RFI_31463, partial [Reticulomyxa filosa]